VAKGVKFEDLPDDWRCPICGASKKRFVSLAAGAL
jgi:rubredoxin